jgi:hypothetical protein
MQDYRYSMMAIILTLLSMRTTMAGLIRLLCLSSIFYFLYHAISAVCLRDAAK